MTSEAELYVYGRMLVMLAICYGYWRAAKWVWRRILRALRR